MQMEIRYSNHPEDSKHYDTETLRRHYLVEKVFVDGEVNLVMCMLMFFSKMKHSG